MESRTLCSKFLGHGFTEEGVQMIPTRSRDTGKVPVEDVFPCCMCTALSSAAYQITGATIRTDLANCQWVAAVSRFAMPPLLLNAGFFVRHHFFNT